MSKNLNGAKKIKKENIAKSRKIVLDSIGESSEIRETPIIIRSKKQLNNSLSPKKKPARKTVKIDAKESQKVKDFLAEGESDDNQSDNFTNKPDQKELIKPKQEETARIKALVLEKRQARKDEKKVAIIKVKNIKEKQKELTKKNKEQQAQEKKVIKQESQEKIINREQEEKRRVEVEKKKIKEQKEIIKELKNKAKIKIRKSQKRKRQLAFKKANNYFIKRYKSIYQFFSEQARMKFLAKFLAWFIIWFVVLAIFLYFVLAVILLRFNSDKKVNEIIINNLPVPAIITKLGFVDYKDYLKLREGLSSDTNQVKAIMRKEAIGLVVLQKLLNQYEITLEDKTVDEVYERLNNNLLLDKEFNKVAFTKINDINSSLSKGENFSIIGKRYGDDFGQADMEKINEEKINKIDGIIITSSGYYFTKDNNFIFIKAITLVDYLTTQQNELMVWVLVR